MCGRPLERLDHDNCRAATVLVAAAAMVALVPPAEAATKRALVLGHRWRESRPARGRALPRLGPRSRQAWGKRVVSAVPRGARPQ